jgi:hypothetical protein
MDEREIILRSVENENFQFIHCDFDDIDPDMESWSVQYKHENENYNFLVLIERDESQITLTYKGVDLKNEKEKRIIVSKMIGLLKEKLETCSFFRLDFLLSEWKIKYKKRKYLINDLKNFENRKTKNFVKENEEKIKKIFEKCKKISKGKNHWSYYFLVIKEEDELPLFKFLIKNKLFIHVATLDEEKIIKVNIRSPYKETVFYQNFAEEMNNLGYNLYYDIYVEYGREYNEEECYEEYQKELYEEKCESYVKKKVRSKAKKKTRASKWTKEK